MKHPLLARAALALSIAATCLNPAHALPEESRAADWVTTAGARVADGNPKAARGAVKEFHAPVLRLMRTKSGSPLGVFLVLPGGGYSHLAIDHEGMQTADFLNAHGFDAAVLEYHIAPGGKSSRDAALADARAAWELLRKESGALGLHAGRFGLIGYSAGGHLAARLTQSLASVDQPDDLALIYPAYLDETRPGSALPAVLPPPKPRRLFLEIARDDNAAWVRSAENYAKNWTANGGESDYRILADGGHGYGMPGRESGAAKDWSERLRAFLAAKPSPDPISPVP